MWGAIISAAISAASSIAGGAASAAATRKAKATAEAKERQRQAENQAWYDRRYNEDPLQRSSAQQLLTKTADTIRQRNRAAAGRAAVTGGTEESVAATKAANAKAIADTASALAANDDARKDKIEDRYLNEKYASQDRLAKSQEQYELNRANNIAQAIKGVGTAAGSIIGATTDVAGKTATAASDNTTIDAAQQTPQTVPNNTISTEQGNVTDIINEDYLKHHPWY